MRRIAAALIALALVASVVPGAALAAKPSTAPSAQGATTPSGSLAKGKLIISIGPKSVIAGGRLKITVRFAGKLDRATAAATAISGTFQYCIAGSSSAASSAPSTPASVAPSTPASVAPSTPASVDPSTPASVDPSTPASVAPSTPASVDPSPSASDLPVSDPPSAASSDSGSASTAVLKIRTFRVKRVATTGGKLSSTVLTDCGPTSPIAATKTKVSGKATAKRGVVALSMLTTVPADAPAGRIAVQVSATYGGFAKTAVATITVRAKGGKTTLSSPTAAPTSSAIPFEQSQAPGI